jgi:agmatinase
MQPVHSFGGDDFRRVSYQEARVVVLPVPYEGTVSYGGGTAGGPRAILEASGQLETYDEELDWSLDDAGILTLPPVDVEGKNPDAVMAAIHQAALGPARDGKLLCGLGGEHSISYGFFTALLAVRGRPFSLLQIDGHADLRETYQGSAHSHACIMARAHELGLPFVQVGIRSLSEPERAFLRSSGLERNVYWAQRIAAAGADEGWMDEVVAGLGEDVYLTVDVDGLDPAVAPATGTPEPGGLDWYTVLRLFRKVAGARRIIGLDVTELSPVAGFLAPNFTVARLVYKMIGYALEHERRGE